MSVQREKLYRWALRGGAIAYSSGMLSEMVLGLELDPRTTLLSELAARNQPHRRIFQAGDLLAGALFLGASFLQRAPGSTKLRVGLAVFGAATIADACSPLDYPISHERLRPEYGPTPWTPGASHRAHFATTGLAGIAAAGICAEHRRNQDPGSGALRLTAGPAVVLGQLAGLLALASPKLLPGIVQRVQCAAFTALCLDLSRAARAPRDAPPV